MPGDNFSIHRKLAIAWDNEGETKDQNERFPPIAHVAGAEGRRRLNAQTSVPSESASANGALDLRVAEQNLDRSEVSGLFVNKGSFCSPKRMRAIILAPKADAGDPFINQPGILSGAQMIGPVKAAWKGEFIKAAATPFKPSEDRRAGRLEDLELHRPLGLLLNDHRSMSDAPA